MENTEAIPNQTNTSTTMPRCATCDSGIDSAASAAFIYALGRVKVLFPSVSVEKEFAQVAGRASHTAGLTDSQTIETVLSNRANRYLVRQLCWILTIEGLDTYLIRLRDPMDLDLLVEALRPSPRPTDVDVLIGVKGPIASPSACNGLMIPVVTLDHLYSFDVDSLLSAIPRPESISEESFAATAEELFWRIMQMADNAGAADEHRALNYLAVRYSAIYAHTAEAFGRNQSLAAVDVRPSRLSGTRRIMDVIFTFVNRQTDVPEKFFVRVDVTDQFPFLLTKMGPFYDLG